MCLEMCFLRLKKNQKYDLTCRDLKEKSGGGGGRHSKEGPDGKKLAQVKTSSSSVLQSSNSNADTNTNTNTHTNLNHKREE